MKSNEPPDRLHRIKLEPEDEEDQPDRKRPRIKSKFDDDEDQKPAFAAFPRKETQQQLRGAVTHNAAG